MSRPTYIVFTNPPTRQAICQYIQDPPEISERPFKKVKLQLDWHTLDISDHSLVVCPSSFDHAPSHPPSSPQSTSVGNALQKSPSANPDTALSDPKDSYGTVVEATFDESPREGRRGSRGSPESVITTAERKESQQILSSIVEGELDETASNKFVEPRREKRKETQEDESGDVGHVLSNKVVLTEILESPASKDQDEAVQEQPSGLDYTSIILPADYQTFPLTTPSSDSNNPAQPVARLTRSSQNSAPYPDMTTFSFLDRSRSNIVEPQGDAIQNAVSVDRSSRKESREQETDDRQAARECSILHSTVLEQAMTASIPTTSRFDEMIHSDISPLVDDVTDRSNVLTSRIDPTWLSMNSIRELGVTSFSFTVGADTSADVSNSNPIPAAVNTIPEPSGSGISTKGYRQTSGILSLVKRSLRESNADGILNNPMSMSDKIAQQAAPSSTSLSVDTVQSLKTSPTNHSTDSFQSSTESSFLPTQADTQLRPSGSSSVHSGTSTDQAYLLHPDRPQSTHPTHPYIHPNLLRPLPSFVQPLNQATANFLSVVTSIELKSFVGKDGRSWLLGELELFDGRNVGRLVVWGEQAREWCDGVGIRKGDVVLFERITIVQPKPPSPIQTLQAYPLDPHLSRSRPRSQPISAYTVFYRTSPPLPGEPVEEWESKRADLRWGTSDTGLGLVGRLKDWVESAGV